MGGGWAWGHFCSSVRGKKWAIPSIGSGLLRDSVCVEHAPPRKDYLESLNPKETGRTAHSLQVARLWVVPRNKHKIEQQPIHDNGIRLSNSQFHTPVDRRQLHIQTRPFHGQLQPRRTRRYPQSQIDNAVHNLKVATVTNATLKKWSLPRSQGGTGGQNDKMNTKPLEDPTAAVDLHYNTSNLGPRLGKGNKPTPPTCIHILRHHRNTCKYIQIHYSTINHLNTQMNNRKTELTRPYYGGRVHKLKFLTPDLIFFSGGSV